MNRILQLDFFRGLFLIIITTNHFLSRENVIYRFTYEFIGWITAAEGFVFLSGLTAGIVYSRKLVEEGEDFITWAAKKRAFTIYKYHLMVFLLIILIFYSHSLMEEYWYYNYTDFKLLFQKPFYSVLLSSLLLYQPIYMDILPMYAIFLLLLPMALKSFKNGRPGMVLTLSFLLYLLGTLDQGFNLFPRFHFMEKVDTGFFNLLSWQLLFVGGVYLGYLTYQNKTSHLLQNKKLFYSAAIICTLLFFFRNAGYLYESLELSSEYWVSKENLGPLRLLNFTALLIVLSYLASRFKQWFSFKPICYLGKYSLEVFSFHILLIVIFRPLKVLIRDIYSIKIMDGLYFNPVPTFMLFFILIPALFLAPGFKNYFLLFKQRLRTNS